MNRIFYFSGSGKSKRLAEFLGKELDIIPEDILFTSDFSAETAVVVFPVYCQNLPSPVTVFLKKLKAEKVAFAATYGKKSFGNVIEDAVKITDSAFIGGICVPCGHSFLKEPDDFDFSALSPFIERIKNPEPASVNKGHKDFYADFFPAERTKIGVRITKNKNCTECGKCTKNCYVGAVKNGSINNSCIRCLRCVTDCPEKALDFKTLRFMKLYLVPGRKNDLCFYL